MDWRKTQVLLVDPDDAFAGRAARAFIRWSDRAVLARAHTLADAAQIHRVLVNLCMNAFDAMRSSGGVLQVDLDAYDHPDLDEAPNVRLTVTDTGRGIDRETLDHIFDPFFTTKAKGKGLGLGLSLVREIVKSQGGYVTAKSQPGKGSVFQVHFPHHKATGQLLEGSAGTRSGQSGARM